jgi:integrase
LTINELMVAYWKHAAQHYLKDGQPTSEQHGIKSALRRLKRVYGHFPAREFGPLKLKSVRRTMIDEWLCRTSVNHHVERMFRWAIENELVAPDVFHGLQVVAGLRRGRSEARESDPVKPAPEAFVAAVLPHVSPQVAAMIQLQILTGMRSGEVLIMRPCDLDTSGKLWTYTPERHKTEHHGHERII